VNSAGCRRGVTARRRVVGGWLFLLALLGSLAAQEDPAEKIVTLEKVVASAGDESVVPTGRPIGSVLGRAGSIADAPRGVSTVTKGQLAENNIQRVEDLTPFIAGAFSAPIFGNAGVPTIRGDLGESYQNGQRKAFNRNSFPISFNGVEAVDAVKGAPPALFGYGNATGGYLNFVTKKPFFDRARTTVTAVVGDWANFRWQVDTGGPLGARSAYRVSYEGSDAGSFYRLVSNRSESLFAALTYLAGPRVTLDFNAEYFRANFTENPGITRPTQALIDHGLYTTGSSVQNGGTGSYFGNTFIPTGQVKIDGSQTLLAPGDAAWARVFNAQATATLGLSSDHSLVNHTYFERVAAEKHSSYYFYSWLPESDTLENRTEFVSDFKAGGVTHETITGLSVRYEHRKSYVDILNEVFDAFDVTMAPATLVYPSSQLFFVSPVPGRPFFATPGGRYPRAGRPDSTSLSATLDSDLGGAGAFGQDQIRFNSRWSLLLAGRLDELWVNSQDPLPRAGFSAKHDSIRALLPSGTASVIYKPAAATTTYLTFNRAAAVEGSSSSGGFGLTNNLLLPATFKNSSSLVELGAKVDLLDHRFFAGIAAYVQRRSRTNVRFNLPDEIAVDGFELEAVYQPSAAFNVGANLAYAHARYANGPLPGSIQTTPAFSPSTPSGNFGTVPPGDYRVPGLPLWLFNAHATYVLAGGLGVSASLSAQDQQNLDLFGIVKIRNQYTLNAGVFHRQKRWEIRLDCLNLTDRVNWRATSTPFAGADLVTRELPLQLRGTLKYVF